MTDEQRTDRVDLEQIEEVDNRVVLVVAGLVLSQTPCKA
jgi:hypothetical protein